MFGENVKKKKGKICRRSVGNLYYKDLEHRQKANLSLLARHHTIKENEVSKKCTFHPKLVSTTVAPSRSFPRFLFDQKQAEIQK